MNAANITRGVGDAVDRALAEVLRPGQRIAVGQAWGSPTALLAGMARRPELIEGSTVFLGMLVAPLPDLPGATIETFFPSGDLGSVEGQARHRAGYQPRSLFELTSEFRSGARPVDVALIQSTEARAGAHSLGVTVDFAHAAAAVADVVVAECGPAVPWTGTGSTIAAERVVAVEAEAAPGDLNRRSGSPERQIAANLAPLVPDGSTLQLGMAGWVEPLVELLCERRLLRVHTGLLSDWVLTLAAAGALARGLPVATGAAGTRPFYEELAAGRAELLPADQTHAPATLAALPSLRALNSVLEVDLQGNVNCEVGPRGRRGGVAGLLDFARAAAAAEDGVSVIALSAAGRGGSRIVPRLSSPRPSLPPGSVDVVVTEYGVADLRRLGPEERPAALAAIAAPEHRRSLLQRGCGV